jgi:hypothetical protein
MKKLFSTLLILGVLGAGCGTGLFGGTGTGNPGVGPQGTTEDGNLNSTIWSALCSKLVQCNGGSLSAATCSASLNSQDNIDTEVGLSVGQYANVSAIVSAVDSGALTVNSSHSQQCVSDVQALSCADPLVQGAFQSGAANPLAGAAAMIPTGAASCTGYFSP